MLDAIDWLIENVDINQQNGTFCMEPKSLEGGLRKPLKFREAMQLLRDKIDREQDF